MLQHLMIQRVEQLHRLRLLYGIHLALYGALLSVWALSTPAQWQGAALTLMIWLPVILLHTALQSLLEVRERRLVCAPAPARAFNYRAIPVQVYDEDGNPVLSGEPNLSLLPRSFGEG